MANGNGGAHTVDGIADNIHDRMALYDALPRCCRDVMKAQSFNYSPVGMAGFVRRDGATATASYMRGFDRQHWRDFFRAEFGQEYPERGM